MFPTTRWSIVAAARSSSSERRPALEALLGAYWQPVFVYLRGRGVPAEDAADVVQELFADLVEKDFADGLDPHKGRLRSWLKACADHHLAHRRARAGAQKRAAEVLPLDTSVIEQAVAAGTDPDRAFTRAWSHQLTGRAVERLRGEFGSGARGGDFSIVLRFFGEHDAPAYREVAAETGMSLPQLKAFLHRSRARLRELVLEEVRETVADPADAERELAELLA